MFALLIFLAVAVLTGSLAGRVRDQRQGVIRNVQVMQSLYDYSRKLSGVSSVDDVLWAAAAHMHAAFGRRIVFPGGGGRRSADPGRLAAGRAAGPRRDDGRPLGATEERTGWMANRHSSAGRLSVPAAGLPLAVRSPSAASSRNRGTPFTSLEGPEPPKDPIVVTPGRHTRLWTVRVAGGQPEPVTPDGVTVWDFAWAPDGTRFALYFGDGPDETDWYRGMVGIVEAGGGSVRTLVRPDGQAGALAWSPDSARVAYVSGEWSDHGLVGGDVFVIPAAGGAARNLTPGIGFSPSWVQWLPDGARLLYCAWDGLAGQVGLLDEATGATTTLAGDIVVGEGAWPRLNATRDGRTFATIFSDARHPAEVYRGALAGPEDAPSGVEWKRLTRLNPLAEETYARVPSQRLTYAGADGWAMQALYTPPLSHDGAGAPPMVLLVHGGPTSAHRDDWSGWLNQALVSAGYAVLRPNPRGSIGRGVAFGDAVLGDMGGKDFEDLMRGVDYAIAGGWPILSAWRSSAGATAAS